MECALVLRGHFVHFVVFGIPVAGLVGAIGLQEIRARLATSAREPERLNRRRSVVRLDGKSADLRIAAAGLVGAAAIHATVIPDHFHEYLLYGMFFCGLTALQFALAVRLVVRPDARLVRYIAIGSAWVVVLYLVSRTSGLPIGPEPWRPESFGGLDVAATIAELVTLIGCVMQLRAASHKHTWVARRLDGARP